MGDAARAETHFIGNKVFMKMAGGRCTGLAIEVEARTFSCSIYEERPDVCRSLQKGSGHCKADFHEKAGRPDVALERLRASRASS